MNKLRFLLSFSLVALLSACSSVTPEQFVTPSHLTGGQVSDSKIQLFWLTEIKAHPNKAADYVTFNDGSWYQTEYVWRDHQLREIIRQGEMVKNHKSNAHKIIAQDIPQIINSSEKNQLLVHIRFNKNGGAIYQQYRIGDKVLPLRHRQLQVYKQDAKQLVQQVHNNKKRGERLIQGYWDGEVFETCDDKTFEQIKFNQKLPNILMQRLASVSSYVAFIGKVNSKANKQYLTIDKLLVLDNDDHDCLQAAKFIDTDD